MSDWLRGGLALQQRRESDRVTDGDTVEKRLGQSTAMKVARGDVLQRTVGSTAHSGQGRSLVLRLRSEEVRPREQPRDHLVVGE